MDHPALRTMLPLAVDHVQIKMTSRLCNQLNTATVVEPLPDSTEVSVSIPIECADSLCHTEQDFSARIFFNEGVIPFQFKKVLEKENGLHYLDATHACDFARIADLQKGEEQHTVHGAYICADDV